MNIFDLIVCLLILTRVFSDGGNFCPEEIDGYRKKLEQMSQKIDKSEGSVMSDLEGIESKRLDQATKIASEFEERYSHAHYLAEYFDMLFLVCYPYEWYKLKTVCGK